MSSTATTATTKLLTKGKTTAALEEEFLLSLIEIYNDLSGEEETGLCDWLDNKESLCKKVKELVEKYGYTGPNNYTAIYWFYQGIKTERKKHKADMSVNYEHSHYPCRTKETILEKLKNFYKDFIEHDSHFINNIIHYKTIHITF